MDLHDGGWGNRNALIAINMSVQSLHLDITERIRGPFFGGDAPSSSIDVPVLCALKCTTELAATYPGGK